MINEQVHLFFFDILVLQVEKRIPKVSKKPLLIDTPCPKTQVEECEVTLKTTPGSEGKNNEDETLGEDAEHFFVTQVWSVFLIFIFQGFKALLC